MGRKNNRKNTGYKPVECQDIAESEYNHLQDNPKEVVTIQKNELPYTTCGNARVTKTGNSLGMDVVIDGEHHYLTVLKVHIDALFERKMTIAHIREYPKIMQQNESMEV